MGLQWISLRTFHCATLSASMSGCGQVAPGADADADADTVVRYLRDRADLF